MSESGHTYHPHHQAIGLLHNPLLYLWSLELQQERLMEKSVYHFKYAVKVPTWAKVALINVGIYMKHY